MIQKSLLKILFVEDLPSDVDLAVLQLRKEKLEFEYTTVCTRIDLVNTLNEFKPDLIISDYLMPSFNGLQALKETKAFNSNIPFILFTGSVNEETAVECIKAGAQDYVIKEHMTRLPFAVKEALEQVAIDNKRKASELLLRKNELKLQSIFSAAPVGIGLVVDRVFMEVNDFFCSLIGYSRKELIGKSTEILYYSTGEFINAGKDFSRQISEKGTGSVETKCKCKDGKILDVIVSSTPLEKTDFSKGITFTVLDITDIKKSEEALKESQQLFETLAKTSPVGIFRTQPDGYTTYVNPRWLELSGLTFEEAIGFGWLNAVHPDDREQVNERWESDIKSRNNSMAEYRFLKSDGTVRWVMGNAEPERTGNKITGYIGTITDITDHHNVEESLRLSEEKYRRIFENVQDVYYETNLNGVILEVSPSIKILSKGLYNIEDLRGRSMIDFYADLQDRTVILDELGKKGAVTDFEVPFKNRDGSIIPCSISAKFVLDEHGIAKKVIGSMHDITDRRNVTEALKLAKEKAEASDKLKTSFLNNISHEVRTPLNGILGFAEIISQPYLYEKDKADSLLMLRESSDRLLNTITNYMDISLLTSGSLSVYNKDFFPEKLFRRIYDNYRTICSNKKLELFLKIPEQTENLAINSDPEIFQKILSHLLNNAVKFTEKGSIQFGYSIHESVIELFVKDTGIGIGKESLEIIFEKFSKEDRGHLKVHEGSGLGLSIAKGMTETIGGTIRVESVLGEGSSFYISFPVLKSNLNPQQLVLNNKVKISPGGNLILIAEDDEANFYYLNTLITKDIGARVLHASNGREAIELFKANPDIKLILMDMKMPVMDGFEATRQIKLVNKDVHIIAITAFAMSGDEQKILSAGCDDYFSKPINKKSLLEKIEKYIKV